MEEILELWERIKKAPTQDLNGNTDTVDWVYRSDCKAIEKFIKENLPKENKNLIHPAQLTIDDI